MKVNFSIRLTAMIVLWMMGLYGCRSQPGVRVDADQICQTDAKGRRHCAPFGSDDIKLWDAVSGRLVSVPEMGLLSAAELKGLGYGSSAKLLTDYLNRAGKSIVFDPRVTEVRWVGTELTLKNMTTLEEASYATTDAKGTLFLRDEEMVVISYYGVASCPELTSIDSEMTGDDVCHDGHCSLTLMAMDNKIRLNTGNITIQVIDPGALDPELLRVLLPEIDPGIEDWFAARGKRHPYDRLDFLYPVPMKKGPGAKPRLRGTITTEPAVAEGDLTEEATYAGEDLQDLESWVPVCEFENDTKKISLCGYDCIVYGELEGLEMDLKECAVRIEKDSRTTMVYRQKSCFDSIPAVNAQRCIRFKEQRQ